MTSSRISDDDIRAVFDVFDVTHTGTISQDEMVFALKALGWNRVTDQDVQQLFASIDTNGAKELTPDQFATLVRSKQRLVNSAEEVHAAFKLFDVDGNGKLSADDLRRAGKLATGRAVPEQLIAEIMRVSDKDQDGFLTFEEFGAAVTKGTFVAPPELKESSKPTAAAPSETTASASSNRGTTKPAAAETQATAVKDVIAGVTVTFRNGLIDRNEVRRALVEFGYDASTLSAESFQELFEDSDADADGMLTRDEYCKLIVGFGEMVDGY
jgi:Ca2+-binding EF-hand superfamily protein